MKTKILVGLLILAVIVLVSVYVQTMRKTEECYGEGKIFDKMAEPDALCCPDLTQLDVAWPDEPIGREDRCVATTWEQVCTKCGDGKCELGENWCICPEDCPKPEEVPCKANIDCGRDFCEQGRNVCHETKYICQEGNCSTITKEYENYVCVEDRCVKELELPQNIFVCTENCEALPIVEFKICPTSEDCNTTKEAYVEFYLDGTPLRTFVITPLMVFSGTKIHSSSIAEKIILESGPVFYPYGRDQQIFRINGAYRVRFKFSDYIKNDLLLSYLDKKLIPGQLLKIDLISTVKEGAEGTVYLYQQSDVELNLTVSELYELTKEIYSNYFRVTGRSREYKAFVEPDTLAVVSGEEGNFYWGHGKLQILYALQYMNTTRIKEVVVAEFAHEYGHAIQIRTICYLGEGMVDGLAFHLGYKKFDWRKENAVECTQFIDSKHQFGRCVFHHLYVNGIFSDSFFNNLFDPTLYYVFENCTSIKDPDTGNTYNEILSDVAGQDLSSILIDIGMNVTAD